MTSDSTLRFRERQEVDTEVIAQEYEVEDVRDAPGRPGKAFVFVARCPQLSPRPRDLAAHWKRTIRATEGVFQPGYATLLQACACKS